MLEMVHEALHLRRHVTHRRVDHVDRRVRRSPLTEHELESMSPEILDAAKCREHTDPESSDRGGNCP